MYVYGLDAVACISIALLTWIAIINQVGEPFNGNTVIFLQSTFPVGVIVVGTGTMMNTGAPRAPIVSRRQSSPGNCLPWG